MTQHHLLHGLRRFGEKPGLMRIEFLLHELGRPQHKFPAVHIGGTNGKGSTASMIAALLQAAGCRVGLFTSPHLLRYNERVVVDGQPIDDESLDMWLNRVAPLAEKAAAIPEVGQPTEFEVATAIALAHFARERVDVAVVEVGLGGRLDSTNVVHPLVSVITPIGMDHTAVLGPTLAHIAAEKAGILRAGVPVVMAEQLPEAEAAVRRRAQQLGAPVYAAGIHFGGEAVAVNPHGTTFDVWWRNDAWDGLDGELQPGQRGSSGVPSATSRSTAPTFGTTGPVQWWRGLKVPLVGGHQAQNGALAVAAARLALGKDRAGQDVLASGGERGAAPRFHIRTGRARIGDRAWAVRGLAKAFWPGRFETVDTEPLTIVDGAHNAEAARAMADTVAAVLPARQIVFVLGMLAEKPTEAILRTLLPLASAVVFTRPSHGRTAPADPEQLAATAQALANGPDGVGGPSFPLLVVEADPAEALAKARAMAEPDGVVIVGGSLYLVGEVKGLIGRPRPFPDGNAPAAGNWEKGGE